MLGALKLVSVWLLVQLSGAIVTQLIAGAVRDEAADNMSPVASPSTSALVALLLGDRRLDDPRTRHVRRRHRFVVYGLLLSLAWVRLSAVDVALTEAAIGSGVTGMLLLGAAARLRPAEASAIPPGALLVSRQPGCCAP